MNLKQRIDSFVALGNHIKSNPTDWQQAKEKAFIHNGWFTTEFTQISIDNIINYFLQETILENFCKHYNISKYQNTKLIGIVMAGNIPLVGFHDLLCALLCGHNVLLKLATKDEVLMQYVIDFLKQHNTEWNDKINTSVLLKNCDAYIATGSDNTAKYFEYYFAKYPSIIRKNRTSVAVLDGTETEEELNLLAKDVHLFFGLGCRNITKIFVPKDYFFEPLIQAFKIYSYLNDHHKYKNNYDYNLALYLLNNQFYMTGGGTLLVENENLFSPICSLHYQFYNNVADVKEQLINNNKVQCIIGHTFEPFGNAQSPSIFQFADGVDTMQFLANL